MNSRFLIWGVLILAFSISSCNSYEHVLKSNDYNYKLTKANEYYDKKWYIRASDLYRSLLPVMKGTRNYEPLYFRYAYSYFYQRDYLDAGYHFKNFANFFPNSKDAEECEYMHAVCLVKDAPKSSLDQTQTIKSLEALQSFINTHASSKKIVEANQLMDEGRKKLAAKDVSSAKLYYNIGQYKASSLAFHTLISDYPDSPLLDYFQYMIIKSKYYFAKSSIETKQIDRFNDAIAAYEELKSNFPDSKYVGEANKFVTFANSSIQKLSKNEQH